MKKKTGGQFKWRTALYVLAISAYVFTVIVGVQLSLGAILTLCLPREILISPITNTIFSIATYLIAIVLIIILPPKIFRKKIPFSSSKSLGLNGFPTWTDIGLGVAGYVASILIAMGLTTFFKAMPWFDADQAQDLGYSPYMMGFERGFAFILLAVIAPIVEEIVFRGFLYGKLRIKIPVWLAIFITSLVFGLIHMQWNVGITVFAMSIVTCALREVTGTIYAGILVHMINNMVAFCLIYVVGVM